MVDGANEVISFCMRSAMPGYMVVPIDENKNSISVGRVQCDETRTRLVDVPTSRQDGVGIEIFTNVDVTFHDGIVRRFVNA
jgi:hypothetical protein